MKCTGIRSERSPVKDIKPSIISNVFQITYWGGMHISMKRQRAIIFVLFARIRLLVYRMTSCGPTMVRDFHIALTTAVVCWVNNQVRQGFCAIVSSAVVMLWLDNIIPTILNFLYITLVFCYEIPLEMSVN